MIQVRIEGTKEVSRLISRLSNMKEGIRSAMTYLVADIESRAVKLTPVRTSNLVNSITRYIAPDGSFGILKATAPYARYVHEGTGLYGPYKQGWIIKPRRKKALYWEGARHPVKKVFAKGQRPNPFFTKAIKQKSPSAIFAEGLRNYLEG